VKRWPLFPWSQQAYVKRRSPRNLPPTSLPFSTCPKTEKSARTPAFPLSPVPDLDVHVLVGERQFAVFADLFDSLITCTFTDKAPCHTHTHGYIHSHIYYLHGLLLPHHLTRQYLWPERSSRSHLVNRVSFIFRMGPNAWKLQGPWQHLAGAEQRWWCHGELGHMRTRHVAWIWCICPCKR